MVDGKKLSGDAKRDRKNALEAVHDYKSEPHSAHPAVSKEDKVPSGDRKRQRKQSLTPSTKDPLPDGGYESKALGAPDTIAGNVPDTTDVEAWLAKVPHGSVVKCQNMSIQSDVYAAASRLERDDIKVSLRQNQQTPLKWQVQK